MKLLVSREVSDGSAKEELCDSEADLVDGAGEISLDVDGNNLERFEGPWEGKSGENFPKEIVPGVRVTEGDLYLALRGALGEHCGIW